MSERLEVPTIDKSDWGEGPWQTEPDRVDWIHAGYACMVLRHPIGGHLCGYVGVDRQHPLYGRIWTEKPPLGLECGHAAINYSGPCDGSAICHVPEPGMPDDVWWFGFDCGHMFDYAPALEARMREIRKQIPRLAEIQETLDRELRWTREVYRDLPYVKQRVESLADELRAKSPK